MKTLRVIHGLTNNIMDIQVPEGFNLALWWKEIRADDGIVVGDYCIPRQWIQHAVLLSGEEAAKMHQEGFTKQ